ncbi:AAA family ATPase [Burkholderiaceae bacterium UC74_6]
MTPEELLKSVHDSFSLLTAVQRDALRGWLTEQFEAYEYAKLEQGGHTKSQTPLRRVFVDLPVTVGGSGHEFAQEERRTLFLNSLLSSPAQPVLVMKRSQERRVDDSDNFRNVRLLHRSLRQTPFSWTLLIGGPGQGKSTLGQLASQIHRAHLLFPFRQILTTRQRELVTSFFPTATRRGDQFNPDSVLLPVQIALPEYTTWLTDREAANDSDRSTPRILQYLEDQPSARGNGLTGEILMQVSRHLPLLLVFDGFDEVGAQKDRALIVASVRELLLSLEEMGARCQILATTRPQGYAGELSQIGVPLTQIQLVPLKKTEALEYGEKLIQAKVAGRDQQKVSTSRLREAAKESATERLMTTPLQVTILVALVQQLGRAPSERWTLFQRYFLYTYNREVERGTWASGLLSQHRNHIERIHARVALLLQVGAESDGGGSAKMPRVRLEHVIRSVLEEDGIAADRVNGLVKEIADAAELRLVFIVEPEPGNYGFEIRSLQEFMAAWALTSGRDGEIEARLMQVASASMFRNVTLFAASRLFSEHSFLRDVYVERVCRSLDHGVSDIGSISQQAARLALETLEEGSMTTQPKRSKLLMEQAIKLLDIPPSEVLQRLVYVADSETGPILESAISKILSSSTKYKNSAWVCLIYAAGQGKDWALQLGNNLWNAQEVSAPQVISAVRRWGMLNRWFCHHVESDAGFFRPVTLAGGAPGQDNGTWLSWIARSANARYRREYYRSPLEIEWLPTNPQRDLKKPDYEPPKEWQDWISIEEFAQSPNKHTLADALFALASLGDSHRFAAASETLWPLTAVAAMAQNEEDLRELSISARNGVFGDIEDWTKAQDVWLHSSHTLDGLLSERSMKLLSLKSIRDMQIPLAILQPWSFINLEIGEGDPVVLLDRGVNLWQTTESQHLKVRLAAACIAILEKLPPSQAGAYSSFYLQWFELYGDARRLFPKPKYIPRADWYRLLEAIPARKFWALDAGSILREMAKIGEKRRPLLIPFLVASLVIYHRVDLAVDAESLKLVDGFVPEGRPKTGADLILQIYGGKLDRQYEADVIPLYDQWLGGNDSYNHLLNAIISGKLPGIQVERLLSDMLEKLGPEHQISGAVVSSMHERFQAKTSELANASVWDRLGLPLPRPLDTNQGDSRGKDGGIVTIRGISLRNVGTISSLDLSLPIVDSELGQWVVILGPNGTGKTTILKSIVLALRDVNALGIWPRDSFSPGLIRICREGEEQIQEANISVALPSYECSVTLRPGRYASGAINASQASSAVGRPSIPLFAYGCRRGSALGGASREVNLSTTNGPEIATLFDETADLIHAETWLVALDGDIKKNSRSALIYGAVSKALAGLLGIKSIYVEDQVLMAEDGDGNKIPFKYLSDGYLTHAGWFLDLVARWIDRQPKDAVIPESFLEKMSGLVLLDEIDLHLHPRWQLDIITKTRQLMPRMSFIVTTHNPLTLVGAMAKEVIVLERNSDGVAAYQREDAPRLLTGGQLYREYFGIEDFLPDELGRKLNRFEFLSGYALRTAEEEHEVHALQLELKNSGIDAGWKIVPRYEATQSKAPQ